VNNFYIHLGLRDLRVIYDVTGNGKSTTNTTYTLLLFSHLSVRCTALRMLLRLQLSWANCNRIIQSCAIYQRWRSV